jgi:site-specific DNA-cytosine methylase
MISPPMVFLSTSPKFLNSEHSKCLSKLYNTLLSNCYEFRLTIYDSSDYGTISSTKKSILFASRIGLRNPPGKPSLKKELTTGGSPFKANIEQHLVAQGFAKNFRVHGDSLSRKIHMIKDAVPPPMANAFGKFARDHMKELVSLTETMEQDCGSRKRKPEAEIVDRGNKRVR